MLYIIISSLCFLAGIVIITWMHNQYQLDIVVEPVSFPQNPSTSLNAGTLLISVCVPARNEERNIERCVEALLAQTYPNFEIIVLDDRSTDATSQILNNLAKTASLRKVPLKIINGSELPPAGLGNPMRWPSLRPGRTGSGCASWTQIPSSRRMRWRRYTLKQLKLMLTYSRS